MAENAGLPWWRSYFDEEFIALYRPLLPPERTSAEVEGAVEMLGLEPEHRVVDLACGWGRHVVELAQRGFSVCGVDRSDALLRHGRELALEAGVRPRWVCADVRALPFARRFDAAVSLYSSLGYFLSDREDLRALQAAHDALRRGGRLLLETMHRDAIAREFAERDWWPGERGEHVWVERDFDAVAGISHERMRWRLPDGREGEKLHSIRIRSAPEWDVLLRRAGLIPLEWYGDWDLEPFTLQSERLIVLATRAG